MLQSYFFSKKIRLQADFGDIFIRQRSDINIFTRVFFPFVVRIDIVTANYIYIRCTHSVGQISGWWCIRESCIETNLVQSLSIL